MNPFDQFDVASANPFDQFDEAPKGASSSFRAKGPDTPLPESSAGKVYKEKASPDWFDEAKGLTSSFKSQVAGAVGFPLGIVSGTVDAFRNNKPLDKAISEAAEMYTKKFDEQVNPAPASAEKYNDLAAEAINAVGIPLMGLHGGSGAGEIKPTKKTNLRAKLDEIKPKETPKAPNPFDQFDQNKFLDEQYAQAPVVDAQQAATLEAALNRKGVSQGEGVIALDSQGNQKTPAMSAQEMIEARQRALEEQVTRQTGLDMGAAERGRQEQAPIPGLQEARGREVQDSINRTQDLNTRGQQMNIVEDYGNNDPMARMPNMRVDENGMPIRADLSMEAQQLQNPLQRNLWGDELARKHEQEAPLGLTEAIDQMPDLPWKGSERDVGIDMLKPQPPKRLRAPRNQRGSVAPDMLFGAGKIGEKLREFGERFNDRYAKKTVDRTGREFDVNVHPKTLGANRDQTSIWVEVHDPKTGERRGVIDFSIRPDGVLTAENTRVAPEYRGKGLAEEMYRAAREAGFDIAPGKVQTDLGHAMVERLQAKGIINKDAEGKRFRAGDLDLVPINGEKIPGENTMRVPRSQRGSVDPDLLTLGLASRLRNRMDNSKRPSGLTPKEQFVTQSTGIPFIPKGEAPAKILADAMAEGKEGPSLFNNLQSGLQQAGDKVNSALMTGVSRWLSYAEKTSKSMEETRVKPVEKLISKLNNSDLINVMDVIKAESSNKMRYTPEQLSAAGVTPKQLEAYTKLRAEFDRVLEVQNQARALLGRKPITPEDAYMASMWNGNWHVPIKDASGKLVWYLKVESRGEANKAIAYLKKNEPGLKLDVQPTYHPENISTRLPRDIAGAYHDMLQYFEGDEAALVRDAMQNFTEEKAYKFRQHDVHFQNKAGVRGFQGDRPWLSDKDNAYAAAKAQIKYLKEAYEWAPMQEALANIKQVMSDEALNKMQPNNMELTKAYVGQAMGLSKNMFKPAEQALAKALSTSPGNIGTFVGDLKTFTYLQQLGLSGGYMLATPLQSFLLGPAMHWKLSDGGLQHSNLKTFVGAIHDGSLAIVGKPEGMSKIGKEAYQYANDNGIISTNMFDEYANLGQHRILSFAKNTLGTTISVPERVARATTFMSFVHHLDQAGMKGTELFQKAEDYTNHTLTNFHRSARPLAVDRLGQMGELAYVYKSPIFNLYNQLSMFARDAKQDIRKSGPLFSALAMTGLLAGPMNLPGASELDQGVQLIKGLISKHAPQYFPHVSDLGLKEWWFSKMSHLSASDSAFAAMGDVGKYGLPSAATGTQLASRFSATIGDLSNPMKNISPVATELREQMAIGKAAVHPNSTTIAQGVYDNSPPILRGILENNVSNFKGPKQGDKQVYVAPSDIEEGRSSYARTKHEENLRYGGLTSLKEADTKNTNFMVGEQSKMSKEARDASMDRLFDAVRRKDMEDVKTYAKAYIANNGDDASFQSDFGRKIDSYALTPDQKRIINAQSLAAIRDVQRQLKLQGR